MAGAVELDALTMIDQDECEEDGLVEQEEHEGLAMQSKVLVRDDVLKVLYRFRVNKHGYKGALQFIIFAVFTILILMNQRDIAPLSTLSLGLQQMVTNTGSFGSMDQFWPWMSDQLCPQVFGTKWSLEQGADQHRQQLSGYYVQEVNTLIGGLSIIQKRRDRIECEDHDFPLVTYGNDCFKNQADKTESDSFKIALKEQYHGKVPDTAWWKQVKHLREGSGGYSLFLPSDLTRKELAERLEAYRTSDFLSLNTRSLEIRFMVYNKDLHAIGLVDYHISTNRAGKTEVTHQISVVPYALTAHGGLHFFGVSMINVLQLLWLLEFTHRVYVIQRTVRRTYKVPVWMALKKKTVEVLPTYFCMKSRKLKPRLGTPLLLYPSLVFLILIWHFKIVPCYASMHAHAQHVASLDENASLQPLPTVAIGPFWDEVMQLHLALKQYFILAGVSIILMLIRLLEYLDFQKKLAAVTGTVRHAFGDMVHLFMVMAIGCQFFAFVAYIVFGPVMENFKTYEQATKTMWLKTLEMPYADRNVEYVDSYNWMAFQIMFKLVILMLLMKMVLAIVFAGYSHASSSSSAQSVPEDLSELGQDYIDRLLLASSNSLLGSCVRTIFGKKTARSSYVSPRRLEKCLRDKEVRKSSPKYVNWSELLHVLNRRYPDANYDLSNVEWLIKRYGAKMPVKDMQFANHLSEHAIQKLRETFKSFDTHNDGTISEYELGLALQAMGYPEMKPEELKKKMASIDKDGTGDIDLDEFCVLVSGCHLDGTKEQRGTSLLTKHEGLTH